MERLYFSELYDMNFSWNSDPKCEPKKYRFEENFKPENSFYLPKN